MRRRFDEGWKEEHVRPGNVAIVGAGRVNDWEWPGQINVSHIYLSSDLMASTAASAFERDYTKLDTVDALNAEDQQLQALGAMLAQELRSPCEGGELLVDSLATVLSVHLIRNFHRNCSAPCIGRGDTRLTTAQRDRVLDFISAHISRNFKLLELAAVVGLGETQFLRCFRNTFNDSPHRYVLTERVRLAVEKIRRTSLTLAEITAVAGFSDQAHMTREVKKATGLTPGALRKP